MQVRTYEAGDKSTAKTSNTETFWLLDRDTSGFDEYKHDDFTDEASAISHCPPSSPPRGAITDVSITDAPKRATEFKTTLDYEYNQNTMTEVVGFNMYDSDVSHGRRNSSTARPSSRARAASSRSEIVGHRSTGIRGIR